MTPEAVALLKRIEELREPPHSMSMAEIAAKLGVGKGKVSGLYYRNLSKKRFDRAGKPRVQGKPSAPRQIGVSHEDQRPSFGASQET